MAEPPEKPRSIDEYSEPQRFSQGRAMNATGRYAERMDHFAAESEKQTRCMTRLTILIAVLTAANVAGVVVQVWLAMRPCPPVSG